MNPKSISLLRTVNHYLLQALEVLNLVENDDYVVLVRKCRAKSQVKNIFDNATRGSLWLVIFFCLEMLDEIVDEVADQPLTGEQQLPAE